MKNKVLEEHTEELYNKKENYKAILSKFEEVEKMKRVNMKKRMNVAAIFLIVFMVGMFSTKIYANIRWNVEFKEYQNRKYETGLGKLEDDGYTEKVNMDYIEQDGIKAKVDSLYITDDTFKSAISFEFDENININSETFTYGCAIYDENKNIYVMNFRMLEVNIKEMRKKSRYILEDIGAGYNKNDIWGNQLADRWGIDKLEASGRNMFTELNIRSAEGFPRSKKIYIRIFDLGYDMIDFEHKENPTTEMVKISDSEWIFEIDVPEKFYERHTTDLKLKEDIPGAKITKLTVTESSLQLTGIFEGINDTIFKAKDMPANEWEELEKNLFYITDENGNRYNQVGLGTYKEGRDSIHTNFEVTKNIFENVKIYLNYTDANGTLYTVELVEK